MGGVVSIVARTTEESAQVLAGVKLFLQANGVHLASSSVGMGS